LVIFKAETENLQKQYNHPIFASGNFMASVFGLHHEYVF